MLKPEFSICQLNNGFQQGPILNFLGRIFLTLFSIHVTSPDLQLILHSPECRKKYLALKRSLNIFDFSL